MRCQHCNQNEATTFIKRNINGHKEELHLCSECAKKLGVMDEFRMPTMGEMFGDTFSAISSVQVFGYEFACRG